MTTSAFQSLVRKKEKHFHSKDVCGAPARSHQCASVFRLCAAHAGLRCSLRVGGAGSCGRLPTRGQAGTARAGVGPMEEFRRQLLIGWYSAHQSWTTWPRRCSGRRERWFLAYQAWAEHIHCAYQDARLPEIQHRFLEHCCLGRVPHLQALLLAVCFVAISTSTLRHRSDEHAHHHLLRCQNFRWRRSQTPAPHC